MAKVKETTKHISHVDVQRDWYLFDASKYILGRLASQIAIILQGKHKPQYSPHIDLGDCVVVINAKKVKVTGRKLEEKKYYRHTGYVGHLKEETLKELLERKPEEVIYRAVKNMLPKNKLQKRRLRRLKVFADEKHPYTKIKFKAVNPEVK
ncbi:MAG: 50S ribosomal protein L13 [Candidatus Atribacteria bacterium]|nr:50S ribosomal protein L13 [Candidatus Atribacteria bacterium]MCD6349397.1 50S ribosomal protein L13 [Candidatus Atribacteria bacterium]